MTVVGESRRHADQGQGLIDGAVEDGLPLREARWILQHVDTASPVGEDRPSAFHRLVARRQAGEPLQYVLGSWPFRSLELLVDRRVLIPRPETERVVEVALHELTSVLEATRGPGRVPTAVDLGTGSGAIALSLAVEAGPRWPGLEVWATDRSDAALAVAALNLEAASVRLARVGATVRLARGHWWAALPEDCRGQLDLVVSNPPYVAEDELADLDAGVRQWEPESALVARAGFAGVGGMADIEVVVAGAADWLRPGGALVVEIAPHQAGAATAASRKAGFRQIRTEPDLTGRTRMLVAGR